METEQFSLCWNNFNNNLRTGFHSLLVDEDLVDVTLAAEGRYIKAHKTVLSVCSPYFKELFKANPCEHPIIILQDVKYSSLNSLLHFMYQGEVSVSQEEIPVFMRVAETLKIKGLTENTCTSNTDTNGMEDSYSNRDSPYAYGSSDSRHPMKRRPQKKMIRPIQPLRPLESPKAMKSSPIASPQPVSSPQPPPSKKQCMQESADRISDYVNSPVAPKREPVDHDDEFRDLEENNLDMSSMLDTKLNESHASGSWTPDIKGFSDSSPGGLLFLKSRKGHPVLINNGHIYTLSHKRDNRSTWYCVKRHTLNCEGCLITTSGPMLLSYSGHNHAQLNDIIQRLQAYSCSSTPTL